MHKISPLIGSLRATPPIIGSEEERTRREYTVQMSKRALIDLCQQEASKFLVQGRYDLAVPGAIQVKESCPPRLLIVSWSPGISIRKSNLIFLLATGLRSVDGNSTSHSSGRIQRSTRGISPATRREPPFLSSLPTSGAGSYFLEGDIR